MAGLESGVFVILQLQKHKSDISGQHQNQELDPEIEILLWNKVGDI